MSKPIITVLDFQIDGISEKEMRSIISLLSSALFKTGKYKVIDVTQRDTLLKEVEFSASGCTDESCQLKIGKMLSAEMIVVGTMGKVGSRYFLSAKMLETETADTRSVADGVYTSLDGMVDDIQNIATKLAEAISQISSVAQSTPQWKPLEPLKSLEPTEPVDWEILGVVVSLVTGLGSGGVGGYLIWDGSVNGQTSIDKASNEYSRATSATAETKWDALKTVTAEVKNKLYWGIGLAAVGVILTGIGVVVAILPRNAETQKKAVSLLMYPTHFGTMFLVSLRL
jgi:hypothetical protein